MAEVAKVGAYPWEPGSAITGNFVMGNLFSNLLNTFRTARGVHAETLLAATGALAGFAAQNSALLRAADAMKDGGKLPPNSIVMVGLRSGGFGLFGNWMNEYIFPERPDRLSLVGLVYGAALEAGLGQKDLPDYNEMAAHFARVFGSPQFGIVRAPQEHQPQVQPFACVNTLWPRVIGLLRSPPPPGMTIDEPLDPVHLPIVLSVVASKFLLQTKDVLAPRLASILIVEAAVIASKIDPNVIDSGRWRIEANKGEISVTSLRD